MTEGSNHIVAIETDDELERSAVAGAAAVERLIADRNKFRNLLAAHERERAASRAVQQDLKRQLAILHQRSNSPKDQKSCLSTTSVRWRHARGYERET